MNPGRGHRVSSNELLQCEVINPSGEYLGVVEDMTISLRTRQVEYLNFSLANEHTLVRVPFSQFRCTRKGLELDVSLKTLLRFGKQQHKK